MIATLEVARAEFLERGRSSRLLLLGALVLFASYLDVPPTDAGYLTLAIDTAGGHVARGLYGSIWIGTLVAVTTSIFLSGIGFYVVKGGIERDGRSGVGEVLAATRVTRTSYVAGKALAGFGVLAVLAGLSLLAEPVLQLLRHEDAALEPLAFVLPMLVVAIPTLALTAAAATLFEVWAFLRGSFGNVVFFGLWLTAVLLSRFQGRATVGLDPFGFAVPFASMRGAASAALPGQVAGFSVGIASVHGAPATFAWNDLSWLAGALPGRVLWLGGALLVALVAGLFFNRFDPARRRAWRTGLGGAATPVGRRASSLRGSALVHGGQGQQRWAFGRLVAAELRLAVRGMGWWWLAVAAMLLVLEGAAPTAVGLRILLPLAWLWPLSIFSQLGCRDVLSGMRQLVASTPRPLTRHLLAAWAACALVAIAMSTPDLLRLLVTGDLVGALVVLTGSAFIPSLALLLGVTTGGTLAFEALYLLLWYLGPLSKAGALDITGYNRTFVTMGGPFIALAAAALFVTIAMLARHSTKT